MNRKFTDMKICLCAKLLQSCPTLCDPMDCSQPGSSVHGFPRQEYWSGLPFPSPGDLPDPGIESTSPAWAGDFSSPEPRGKPRSLVVIAVQLLSRVRLFVTPWTAARQASLSFTISQSLLKLLSIGSVRPSNRLILCRLLLLLPSIFPSIRVLSDESALCIRWPK